MSDRDIILIEVGRRGHDGDYTGASEVAALGTRVDTLEARPNITALDAVPNVTAPSPANGNVLTWNGTAWVASAPSSAVSGVADTTSVDMTLASGVLSGAVKYAGTGTAATAARSDHDHLTYEPHRATFGPQAYMSSGTRNLASTSVVLTNGVYHVVRAKVNVQMRGGDPGPCYYQLRLTINGNARTSPGGANGFWCVQGVPDPRIWEHHITIVGTGAAITVSADVIYYGGGGFYTDAGEIVVERDAAR